MQHGKDGAAISLRCPYSQPKFVSSLSKKSVQKFRQDLEDTICSGDPYKGKDSIKVSTFVYCAVACMDNLKNAGDPPVGVASEIVALWEDKLGFKVRQYSLFQSFAEV